MATLINGDGNQAIYAQQDADWYAALMGGQTVITAVGNQFDYDLLDANTIGVKDGVIITKEGRRIQLDANAIDSFNIPTGGQGTTNYYIIGYHLVTGDLSEQTAETFVQLMENATDTIPEGSFRDGDDDVYISLYRVQQNDLTLGTITLLLPRLSGSFQSLINELNSNLNLKQNKTDNNLTTSSKEVVGAINEMNTSLSGKASVSDINNINAHLPIYGGTKGQGLITNALLVDMNNVDSDWNKVGFVNNWQTVSLPPDCYLGVREVIHINSSFVFVKITGIDTNSHYAQWGNSYDSTIGWTGWMRLGPVFENTTSGNGAKIEVVANQKLNENDGAWINILVNSQFGFSLGTTWNSGRLYVRRLINGTWSGWGLVEN